MSEIIRIESILKEAAKSILLNKTIETEIMTKGYQDVVTQKDVMAERFIIAKLKELYPNDAFIAEEEHHNELTDRRTWILDPIDGTFNFSRNHPLFGIQLALYEKKEAIMAIIYLPIIDEMYTAERNNGAHLNGRPITQNKTLRLKHAIVSLGDFSKSNPSSRPFQIKIMGNLMDVAMKLRIQGASSVDFAFASSGKTNCHIIFTKRVWELAAGMLLCEEAGMAVKAFQSDDFDGTGYTVCANSNIEKELHAIIKNIK